MMDNEKIKKELFFANHLIDIINHVERPTLVYDEEKEVVKKALRMYIDDLEDKQRGR